MASKSRSYTDEQIQFIIDKKNKDNLSWEKITEEFNKEYLCNPKKGVNSLEHTYRKYKDIPAFCSDYIITTIRKDANLQRKSTFLAKENRELINVVNDSEDIKDIFNNFLKKSKFKLHRPLKLKNTQKKFDRTIIAHLSDTHFGALVDKNEMGSINSYNYRVACRRVAHFCKNLAYYKIDKRKQTDLILVLNGDILAGIIHSREFGVELLSKQFIISLSILIQAISYLSQNFKNVIVYTSSGNHDRMIHKGSLDRATIHKWDSYATMIFFSLQQKFSTFNNVEINIPKTPFISFYAQGHRVFATHCDTIVNLGNTSKTLPMDNIANQINKINNSDLATCDKFKIFMFAHVHSVLSTITNNGEHVFINGSVLGSDSFAQSIGVFSNNPCQQFVEITKEHVGDMRFVSLKEADNNKDLDKIIDIIDIE
jgi:hypothetical protein